MKKSQNCLFELRQSGSRRHDASSEPECRAQAEATAIRNHHQVFDLIDQLSAALAIAVKGMMDLLDITPDQRELRLDGIRHLAVICRRHRASHIPPFCRGSPAGSTATSRRASHLLRPTIRIPRGPKLNVLVSPPTCMQHSPVASSAVMISPGTSV